MIQKLPTGALRWRFEDLSGAQAVLSQKRRKKVGQLFAMAQDRALSALELGLGIKQRGYNIFVVGSSGTGRTSTVNQLLKDRARKEPTPDDIVVLYNFENRDRPLTISVPAASGPKLRRTYDQLVERMLIDLEKTFETDHYLSLRQNLQDLSRRRTDDILQVIEQEARAEGFVLQRGGGALTLTPANEKGAAITEEEFEHLQDERKQLLEQSAEKLEGHLEDAIRRVRVVEREGEEATKALERETARVVVDPLFDNAKQNWKHVKAVVSHLEEMHDDVLNRLRRIVLDERDAQQDGGDPNAQQYRRRNIDDDEDMDSDEPTLLRYRVNVLVTRPKSAGAPVVQETHPTSSNLIGRIEQRLRAGETITDHTRIKAGALYEANGGYLVLEAQDILRDPSAWEGLKRALKNREIELDDPGEPGRMVSIASLRPEPVPLSMKVILIGTPELYYALAKNDLDFGKLFKVKADFDTEMDKSKDHISKFLQFVVSMCAEEDLRKLTPDGAGRVLEEAVRISGNQKKLTTRLGDIADLIREANFWASKEKSKRIDAKHVRRALQERSSREGFLESKMIEDILEHRVSIETEGDVVGQANALTVIELGNYNFGVPLRVTSRVGSGRGELIDIERETELGGPIHTKGTLIIRGFLTDRFGRDLPLGFNATICMEQTYTDVDGDSASLAEACTLISALANIPITQTLALTGSMDQRGQVQAIGGVNEKIEGFFRVCKARGTKNNGVIIPASNKLDLMLNEEVVAACQAGTFDIYTVDCIEDALKLLTRRFWDKGDDAIKPAIMATLKRFHDMRDKRYSFEEDEVDGWKSSSLSKSKKVELTSAVTSD